MGIAETILLIGIYWGFIHNGEPSVAGLVCLDVVKGEVVQESNEPRPCTLEETKWYFTNAIGLGDD